MKRRIFPTGFLPGPGVRWHNEAVVLSWPVKELDAARTEQKRDPILWGQSPIDRLAESGMPPLRPLRSRRFCCTHPWSGPEAYFQCLFGAEVAEFDRLRSSSPQPSPPHSGERVRRETSASARSKAQPNGQGEGVFHLFVLCVLSALCGEKKPKREPAPAITPLE
jgi:hypothetical protein